MDYGNVLPNCALYYHIMKGVTSEINFTSNRLSSCRFCDEIAVFYNGKIVQKGSHSELVNLEGMYHKLWYAQAQYYAE